MSIERFLVVKQQLFNYPDLRDATTFLSEELGPVLTLRTVAELGRALGGPQNTGRYEKCLDKAAQEVPPELREQTSVAELNIHKVYRAEPALAYLAKLACAQQPALTSAEIQQHFSIAKFFNDIP